MRFLDGKKKRIGSRRLTGGLVGLCLVAVMVLVVGTGLTNQRAVEKAALLEEPAAATLEDSIESEPVSEEAVADDEELVVESDPLYGNYEKATALILVDGSTDRNALSAAISSADFIETKDISDQDGAAGYVKVVVDSSLSMSELMAAFEDQGISAQPNYVYQILEEDNDDIAVQESSSEAPLTELDVLQVFTDESADSEKTKTVLESVLENAAEGDYAAVPISTAQTTVNDAKSKEQWELNSIDIYRAWDISKCKEDNAGTPEVSVCVLDSGITKHEDLEDNVIAVYNSSTHEEGQKFSQSGSVSEIDYSVVTDYDGHGTHVAGTVAAKANNGKGVAGASYNAGIVAIKATTGTTRNFTTTSIADGYQWLIEQVNGPLEDANVRVMNLSLGGPGSVKPDHVMYTKITAAKNEGILTVCAAGNAGTYGDEYYSSPFAVVPGDYEDCFTVISLGRNGGSLDSSGTYSVGVSGSSNYNCADGEEGSDSKNISAPGETLWSCINTETDSTFSSYGTKSGTSMATPVVSGVAALVFAYDPELTPDQVQTVLEQTATDLTYPGRYGEGWDKYSGYGEVDAYHALQALSAEVPSTIVEPGGSTDLMITCADGSTLPASEWTWSSNNEEVATVDPQTGKVTCIGDGSAKIVGTYRSTSSRSAAANSTLSVSTIVSTEALDLSNATIRSASAEFAGNFIDIDPADHIVVEYDGTPVSKDDYVVTWEDSADRKNVGQFQFTITAVDGSAYTGSKSAEFSITPRSVKSLNSFLDHNLTYDPSANAPESYTQALNLVDKDCYNYQLQIPGSDNPDFSVTYENVDKPSYQATDDRPVAHITGTGNYEGTVDIYFNLIAPSKFELKVEPLGEYVYTGSMIEPVPTVTYNGIELKYGTDFTCSYSQSNINVGTGNIEVRGAGAYADSLTGGRNNKNTNHFTIVAKSLEDADVYVEPKQTLFSYDGSAKELELSVTYNGNTLRQGSEYTVSYVNNVNVGEATAIITANSRNYTGQRTITFTIEPRSLSNIELENFEDFYYNGQEQRHSNLVVKDAETGTVLSEGRDYTLRYENNRDVGMATLHIDGQGNYANQTVPKTFHILATSGSSGTQASNPGNQGGNSGNQGGNQGSSNQGSSAQAPSSAPAVSGKWIKQSGRWWFSYDFATQISQGKQYPVNEWVSIGGKLYHFDNAGWMHANWLWTNGAWYWLGSDGAMKTGWIKTGGKWYYLGSDGKMLTGKQSIGGDYYILNTSSGAMHTGWVVHDGAWHWCKSSGAMHTGWIKTGGKWYYLGSDGKMLTGKQLINGKYYFLDPGTGAMKTGWVAYDNCWYWCDSSGAMQTGWLRNAGKWYYLDPSSGIMKMYWQNIDGKTYFFNTSGDMVTGWVDIDGSTYFFTSSGSLATNVWIADKWYVDETGKLVDTK